MKIYGAEIQGLDSLCKMLTANNIEKVYLSHYPGREKPTRKFAMRLRNRGFLPMVAADYRKHGEEAVSNAIGESQFLIVCAFTDDEMKECKSKGISFISLR